MAVYSTRDLSWLPFPARRGLAILYGRTPRPEGADPQPPSGQYGGFVVVHDVGGERVGEVDHARAITAARELDEHLRTTRLPDLQMPDLRSVLERLVSELEQPRDAGIGLFRNTVGREGRGDPVTLASLVGTPRARVDFFSGRLTRWPDSSVGRLEGWRERRARRRDTHQVATIGGAQPLPASADLNGSVHQIAGPITRVKVEVDGRRALPVDRFAWDQYLVRPQPPRARRPGASS